MVFFMKCHRKLNFKIEQHYSLQNNGLVACNRHVKASTVFYRDPSFGLGQTSTRSGTRGNLLAHWLSLLLSQRGKKIKRWLSETPITVSLSLAIVTAKLRNLRRFCIPTKAEQLFPDVWYYSLLYRGHPWRELKH